MQLRCSLMGSMLIHGCLLSALWVVAPWRDRFVVVVSVNPGEALVIELVPSTAEPEPIETPLEVVDPDESAIDWESTPVAATPRMDVVEIGRLPQGQAAPDRATMQPVAQAAHDPPPAERVVRALPPTAPPPRTPPPDALPRRNKPPQWEVAQAAVTLPPLTAQEAGAKVDQLPRSLPVNLPPAYPRDALLARIEGRVMLRVRIDADGVARDVRVDVSSGSSSLDDAALDAVRRWRFDPARRSGQAVAFEVLVPVKFTIQRS